MFREQGGRLAVSDVINTAPLSAELQSDPALLCGCLAGTTAAERVEHWLTKAGFVDVRVTPQPEAGRELGGRLAGESRISSAP